MLITGIYSCISTTKFQSSQEAFERKHYFTASQMLEQEILKIRNPNVLFDKYYLLGESYRMMNMPGKAVKWYSKALKIEKMASIYFKLVEQLKKLNKYDQAIAFLNDLINKSGNSAHLQRELSICKQAKYWFEHPDTNIVISDMPVNTAYSEFCSALYLNEYLVFSSDKANENKEKYGWTGNFFYDIYLADKNSFSNIEPFSNRINSKFNDASACFANDDKEIFFVRCGDNKEDISTCKIYHSLDINGEWSEPQLLSFQKQNINYISPYFDEAREILFFSSDQNEKTGGYDIFYSLRNGDKWTTPVPLPSYINTPGDEKFISGWKKDIYFSSDYLPGLGGLDIFKTGIDSTGKFLPPQHLDYPLNSGSDDFYLLKNSASSGYFSSSRLGGKGSDDIYKFKIKPPAKTEIKLDTTTTAIEKKQDKKVFLAIKILENVYAVPDDPNSKILGKKIVKDATISFGNKENIKLPTGSMLKEVHFDTLYHLAVGKKGYLSRSTDIIIKPKHNYPKELNTINIKLELDKLYIGKEIVLKDIYYDYNKWNLRKDAIPTMNKLFNILKNNPAYRIRIASHTDCRGEDDYNLILSQKRAQSVIDYLQEKGIVKTRLEAIGHGESKPVEKCVCDQCSETQHQKNRRTTFELIK